MRKSWYLDRRTFLRGAGVSIALPMFEAMLPAQLSANRSSEPVRRLVCVGTEYGMHPQSFFPTTASNNYTLPELLQPMRTLRSEFSVIEGLDHGVSGGHKGTSAFLTGIRFDYGSGATMYSMDQFAADRLGSQTRFASLPLSIHSSKSWSWNRHGVMMRSIGDPRTLFDLLFRQTNARERSQQSQQIETDQSILDAVQESARSVRQRLGSVDRRRFDEFLGSIDEIERRLVRSQEWLNRPKPRVEGAGRLLIPTQVEESYDRRIVTLRMMFDLLVLALQTDSTRIATLHIPGGNARLCIEGVDDGYHSLTHHGQDPEKIRQLKTIESLYTRELGQFLTKLRTRTEGAGNLLEHTMVLFGSGMGNASSHSNRNLPVLLAGGGFRHGRSLKYRRTATHHTPLCDLFVSMLQRLGVETDSFSTSRGTLTDFG